MPLVAAKKNDTADTMGKEQNMAYRINPKVVLINIE